VAKGASGMTGSFVPLMKPFLGKVLPIKNCCRKQSNPQNPAGNVVEKLSHSIPKG
jgi:hypothetical protein